MKLFTFADKVFKGVHHIYAAIMSLNMGFKYSDYFLSVSSFTKIDFHFF